MLKLTEWTLSLAYASDALRGRGDKKAAQHLDNLLDWMLIHLEHLDEIDAKLPTPDEAEFTEKLRIMKKRLQAPPASPAAIVAQRLDHMENPSTEHDPDAPPAAQCVE